MTGFTCKDCELDCDLTQKGEGRAEVHYCPATGRPVRWAEMV
jgi:hypothetical protein